MRARSPAVGAGGSSAGGASTATRGDDAEMTVTGLSTVSSSPEGEGTFCTAGRSVSTAIIVRGYPACASIALQRAGQLERAGRAGGTGSFARHCWSSRSSAGGTSGRWVRGGVECRMRAVSAREELSPLGIENGERPTSRFQIVAPRE